MTIGETTGRRQRRVLTTALAAVALSAALAASAWASAQSYIGAAAANTVTMNVNAGAITSFAATTGRLTCAGTPTSTAPYTFALPTNTTVPIISGAFSFHTTSTPQSGETVGITVSGQQQAAGDFAGTITADAANYGAAGNSCHQVLTFDIAPIDLADADDPLGPGFTTLGMQAVGQYGMFFDGTLASGTITDYNTGLLLRCPSSSTLLFHLDTAVRPGVDPIPVTNANFSTSGVSIVSGYNTVAHWTLTGTLSGSMVSGTVSASTQTATTSPETCSTNSNWTAFGNYIPQTPTATAPPPPPAPPTNPPGNAPPPPHVTIKPNPKNHKLPDLTVTLVGERTLTSPRHFYYTAEQFKCVHKANFVAFTVLKLRRVVSCKSKQAIVSGYVGPNSTVAITVRALRENRHGHILSHGAPHSLKLFMPASDASWLARGAAVSIHRTFTTR
jgi:hypothetical protein